MISKSDYFYFYRPLSLSQLREREWFDAMIEARNEKRPFSWILL